jgi:hypothetical protein
MPADTKAMGLLIRMVPLMRREFGRSIDTNVFFGDPGYASTILGEALKAEEPRLVTYARELRFRIEEITRSPGSSGSSTRSSSSSKAAAPKTTASAQLGSGAKPSHTTGPASHLPEPAPSSHSKLPKESLFGNSELPDRVATPKNYIKGLR